MQPDVINPLDALTARVSELESILRIVRRDLAESANQAGMDSMSWDHTSIRSSLEHGEDVDRIHALIEAAIPDAYSSQAEYDKARDRLWKRGEE